jgi:GT2 family glycosyltransferase
MSVTRMTVTVVTVTYGQRSHLLIQALDAARAQGAAEAVVIDNGAHEPIREIVAARYGNWARVHAMGTNRGSAAGFKTGIEIALLLPADYLLLLDDDNVASAGCLAALQEAFTAATRKIDAAHLLCFAFRADRHQWIIDNARGVGPKRRRSTFRGFHVLDTLDKIKKRLALMPPPPPPARDAPATINIETAAYGGLFFHKSLVQTIGLPDEKFFLYEDDTEYTSRLIARDGQMLLVTGARIYDYDTSWNLKNAPATSFSRLLDKNAHVRLFYAFRNGVFLDLRPRRGSRPVVLLNMAVYMFILFFFSLAKARLHEFRLLSVAMWDGMTGNFKRRPHDDVI